MQLDTLAMPLDAQPVTASRTPVPLSLGCLSTETISTTAGLEALAADWRWLEAGSARAVFFQSHDWCRFIWTTQAEHPGKGRSEPRVLVVRDGTRPVAIWPLAITHSLAGRFAHDLSDPFAQYSDCLLSPAVATPADLDQVMVAALAEIALWRIDGLVLRKVRADAALAPWLAAHADRLGGSEQAPAIELAAFEDVEAYRRSINAKTRKNLRNYRNRLARAGDLSHAVIDTPADRAAVIERCFLRRGDWLETSGLSSTAFADPLFAAVVAGLAKAERGAPAVTAMRLALVPPGAPEVDLSVHWGFIHQNRYYAFMAAKNPAFDDFSPGRLHLEDVIGACAQRGLGTIDMLAPAMPYKQTWATTSVTVDTFGLALSARGRLVIQGWHGLLRPALKARLLAMSPATRRWVMAARHAVTRKPASSAT